MNIETSRRRFLSTSAAAWAGLALGAKATGQAEDRPPNLVIIFTDDQGYGDVGCYGATDFATPNLDRMAAQGMRFTDFYVAGPVCTPSRAALLTGCYPKRLGLAHRVLFPYSEGGLHPDETTLAEMLKQRGYATACIGKWHLGHHPPFMPGKQGFDYFFGVPYSNDMDAHHYKRQNFQAPPLPLYRQEEVIEHGPDQRYLTKRYTEEATRFIRENEEQPFFLYLPHNMPHLPLAASEDFKDASKHGLYGDVIQEIDWSVGEVLKAIDDAGLAENTWVVFTSDNGCQHWGEKRLGYRHGSNAPLRGMKNTTWDGGMREPCIMRWPGTIPAGTTCGELATAMDLLPTMAALAKAGLPPRTIDGKNISPLIHGKPGAISPHEAFYYYRDDRLQAVRSGEWKLHVYRPEWGKRPKAPLLYDLSQDPGEENDVAEAHPEVVRRLHKLAARARAELGDAVTGDKGSGVRAAGHFEPASPPGSGQ